MIDISAMSAGRFHKPRPSDLGFRPGQVEAIMSAIHTRGDRLMRAFILFHCGVAMVLALFYGTWQVTVAVSIAATAMFLVSMSLLPRSLVTRCVAGISLATFCALHIYQMHGLAEMHFFFFTACTMMIVYQDWRSMWPGALLIIGQHIWFAVMTNAGAQLSFFEVSYVDVTKLFFHFSIVLMEVGICGYWSHILRQHTLKEARHQALVEEQLVRAQESEASLQRQAEEMRRIREQLEADIVERRRLEEQLLQAQKMESIGRLAGGVAHDFNNLLTAILGYAELADMERPAKGITVGNANDSQTRDCIHNIQKAAQRAADLTRQLLAFARKQVIMPKVVNLNELIPDIDKMLRRLIGEDIEMITRLTPGIASVKVDPGQIGQVLINLVVNARDAMPGGGKLFIETDQVYLDAEYAHQQIEVTPGQYVVLSVRDTGEGISESAKAHLFEPFFTTKEQGKGTGLGLAMVYGIIKQSGGHLRVFSEPGHGAEFKIYLSCVPELSPAAPAAKAHGTRPVCCETILLVEDEPWVRDIGVQALKTQGYRVLAASNGQEALELVDRYEGPIHMMVTDVVMPRMSGPELAKRLQATHPDTKILFTSGYTEDTIGHHGVLDDGTAFLYKPFTPLALVQKVRDLLQASHGSEAPRVPVH